MKEIERFVCGIVLLPHFGGCAVEEVRYKNKLGAEWRHTGSNSREDERYTLEPGFDLKWDKGVSTGVSYRRRDVNDGNGDHDDGLFVDFSFPIWKRKKPDAQAERIEALERGLAELQAERSAAFARHDPASEEYASPEGKQRVVTTVETGSSLTGKN